MFVLFFEPASPILYHSVVLNGIKKLILSFFIFYILFE